MVVETQVVGVDIMRSVLTVHYILEPDPVSLGSGIGAVLWE